MSARYGGASRSALNKFYEYGSRSTMVQFELWFYCKGSQLHTCIPPYKGIGSLYCFGLAIFCHPNTLMKSFSVVSFIVSCIHMWGWGGFLNWRNALEPRTYWIGAALSWRFWSSIATGTCPRNNSQVFY